VVDEDSSIEECFFDCARDSQSAEVMADFKASAIAASEGVDFENL
jgi:hypothetical protein